MCDYFGQVVSDANGKQSDYWPEMVARCSMRKGVALAYCHFWVVVDTSWRDGLFCLTQSLTYELLHIILHALD